VARKNDTSNLKDIGKGILDTISEVKEPKSEPVIEEKENSSLTEYNNTIKEEKNNDVNDNVGNIVLEENNKHINSKNNSNIKKENNKSVKESKSKRSFMLTETAIKRLDFLKLCMNDKDLSTIVEEAINMSFEKNKKSIELLLHTFNEIK